MTENAKTPVSVRLPPAMVKRLRAAAVIEGATVTDLVLRACEAAPWGREPASLPPLSCATDHGGAPCPEYP
jgi:hypothetical protein